MNCLDPPENEYFFGEKVSKSSCPIPAYHTWESTVGSVDAAGTLSPSILPSIVTQSVCKVTKTLTKSSIFVFLLNMDVDVSTNHQDVMKNVHEPRDKLLEHLILQ